MDMPPKPYSLSNCPVCAHLWSLHHLASEGGCLGYAGEAANPYAASTPDLACHCDALDGAVADLLEDLHVHQLAALKPRPLS